MAQEKYDISIKEINDYDEEYDNDGLDDYSDDYDDDERYPYSGSLPQDREGRRGNSFSYSGSGHSNEINEDNRKDHHNQLERKRRASIKSSYTELREAIPSLRDNKASRSVILQKAVDYLEELNRRNNDHVACVDHFSSENLALEAKCREIENQVQMLMRQQRQGGGGPGHSIASSQNFNISIPVRSSFRNRDEEDSNDLPGSTNSTPTASTSRSITSSTSASTSRTEAGAHTLYSENANEKAATTEQLRSANPTAESGSNSSSADFYDDIEDVVAPKKPRKE